MKTSIPNKKWLDIGAIVGVVFAAYMGNLSGMATPIYLLMGIPISYLFLMFTNPKDQANKGAHIAVASPVCALLWPVILLALLLQRPWNAPKWVNRNAEDRS